MSTSATSVIIVSRGRPDHLKHCLSALMWQDHPEMELVVVADSAGLAQAAGMPIKRVCFESANISEARNLGIALAAGEIIAFIDDDSIAEPTWLSRLTAPFANPRVVAATGWTRDRDGFRWQSRAARMTATGLSIAIDMSAEDTLLLAPEDGAPVSTLGTNCAFRAEHLRQIGGFDPIFAYHLDESDLNMRMARTWPDALTAIVPSAQVIHARAGSPQRTAGSVPQDLGAIGRSAVLFARRHGRAPPEQDLIHRTRRRLIRHMLDGEMDPLQIGGVMSTLKAGLAEGRAASLPSAPGIRRDHPPAFLPLPTAPAEHLILTGWHWQGAALRETACKATQGGQIVTIILLTPSILPHRIRYHPGGWFEQTGGLWGPSEPCDPPAKSWRAGNRFARETGLAQARRNRNAFSCVGAQRLF